MDTAETSSGTKEKRTKDDIETDTPYEGAKADRGYSKAEILFFKRVAIAGLSVLGIVAAAIYFYACLESNVEHLQEDVKEIKSETETLVKQTIKQDSVLNGLETSINDIKMELRASNSQSKRAPVNNKK